MVVANASVDIPALKARHPLGDAVEASGVRLRGRGRVPPGRPAPSTTRPRAALRCTATPRGSTASAVGRAATCWTSSSGSRG